MNDQCFIMQPFDGGKYGQRYKEVFEPAVKAAGLDPYRVDRDQRASIPVESIERGIRESIVCFADITEDNPNVWLEVGLAIASKKEICLICHADRIKFPFDVQHRRILKYTSDAPSHFDELRENIRSRLEAMVRNVREVSFPTISIVAPSASDELTDFEVQCLGIIAGANSEEESSVYKDRVDRQMEQSGYNNLATNLAVRGLKKRNFISTREIFDDSGFQVKAVQISSLGWEWLEKNVHRYSLKAELDRPPF